MNSEILSEELRKNGIRPSLQRMIILDYLKTHFIHPNIETIYKSLMKSGHFMSKTTIYNTLSLFKEKNVVLELTIDEEGVRYDYNTNPHGHFRCEVCGEIYDIFSDELKFYKNREIEGHAIRQQDIFFTGVCKECLKKF